MGKVYLHAVLDTFGSYAFGFLHVSKQPEAAVAVLHNDVLPFHRNLDLPIGAILTDNGREFFGTERHPYEFYLDLNGLEHRRTKVRTPKSEPLTAIGPRTMASGFVERFNGTILGRVRPGEDARDLLRHRQGPPLYLAHASGQALAQVPRTEPAGANCEGTIPRSRLMAPVEAVAGVVGDGRRSTVMTDRAQAQEIAKGSPQGPRHAKAADLDAPPLPRSKGYAETA